jgi:hypothetical protein
VNFRGPKNFTLTAKGRQNEVEIVEPHDAPGDVAPLRMLRQQLIAYLVSLSWFIARN